MVRSLLENQRFLKPWQNIIRLLMCLSLLEHIYKKNEILNLKFVPKKICCQLPGGKFNLKIKHFKGPIDCLCATPIYYKPRSILRFITMVIATRAFSSTPLKTTIIYTFCVPLMFHGWPTIYAISPLKGKRCSKPLKKNLKNKTFLM